jgi:hypothetical protein
MTASTMSARRSTMPTMRPTSVACDIPWWSVPFERPAGVEDEELVGVEIGDPDEAALGIVPGVV